MPGHLHAWLFSTFFIGESTFDKSCLAWHTNIIVGHWLVNFCQHDTKSSLDSLARKNSAQSSKGFLSRGRVN